MSHLKLLTDYGNSFLLTRILTVRCFLENLLPLPKIRSADGKAVNGLLDIFTIPMRPFTSHQYLARGSIHDTYFDKVHRQRFLRKLMVNGHIQKIFLIFACNSCLKSAANAWHWLSERSFRRRFARFQRFNRRSPRSSRRRYFSLHHSRTAERQFRYSRHRLNIIYKEFSKCCA